jgi:hypothetical protein
VSKRGFTRAVLIYEALGFLLVMGVIWADETFNLPHYLLGAPGTLRWQEAAWESGLVFLLGVLTLCLTYRDLNRIRYLEGFLPVCSYCKRIRAGDHWIPIEEYISDHSAAYFSHGLCPDCLKREYPEFEHKGVHQTLARPSSSVSAK